MVSISSIKTIQSTVDLVSRDAGLVVVLHSLSERLYELAHLMDELGLRPPATGRHLDPPQVRQTANLDSVD